MSKAILQKFVDDGCLLSVNYDGEVDLEPTTDVNAVYEAVDAVDDLTNVVVTKDGQRMGAIVIITDLDEDEQIADYSYMTGCTYMDDIING